MFSPRKLLQKTFDLVVDVEEFDSKDAANLKLLERPELGVTFTKLNCWKLVQFTKCVFLDADTLVIQNSDELFDREEFSAAPDAGWPDCFNSGVFVFVPSHKTYEVTANITTLPNFAQWKESFSQHLWFAFVVVFLAEMGRIPCCGRPESSSSIV